jgi:hypothetical protein
MQTGTIFSGIGHAGLILWVLVGDWLFTREPAEEIIVTSVSMITTEEFDALQAAATATPDEEPAPVRPQPRPEPEPVVEPEPEPEPVVEPEPEPEPEPVPEPESEPVPEPVPEVAVAEEEQPLASIAPEENPLPEAEEIIAPQPVEVETEAETSETPTPAVSEDPAADELIEETPTDETVPEDTGDVTLTEANEDQDEATGMTTSIRPKTRPEKPAAETELASAEPVEETPEEPADEPVEAQPVDDQATDAAIDALLGEAVEEPVEQPIEEPSTSGGQDLPQGPPLSGSEMSNIGSAIARKWNLGASSTDALRTKVVIRVSFAATGQPTGFELIESNGPTETAINQLYQTAQRAVNRAYADGGLPMPPEKYDTWRVMDMVFDANGLALR